MRPSLLLLGLALACSGDPKAQRSQAQCGEPGAPYSSITPLQSTAPGTCGEWPSGAIHVVGTRETDSALMVNLYKCLPRATQFPADEVAGPQCQGSYLSSGLQIPIAIALGSTVSETYDLEPLATRSPELGRAAIAPANDFSDLGWQGTVELADHDDGFSGVIDAFSDSDEGRIGFVGTFCWDGSE